MAARFEGERRLNNGRKFCVLWLWVGVHSGRRRGCWFVAGSGCSRNEAEANGPCCVAVRGGARLEKERDGGAAMMTGLGSPTMAEAAQRESEGDG